MDKSIMERIQEYIALCPHIDSTAPFMLDDISDKDKSYCIMSSPQSQPIPDVLGNLKITVFFEFGLREVIVDDIARKNNVRFLENFNDWIYKQNYNKIYPELPADCTGIALEVSDSGYLIQPDEARNTGLYISQLKFTYRKKVIGGKIL